MVLAQDELFPRSESIQHEVDSKTVISLMLFLPIYLKRSTHRRIPFRIPKYSPSANQVTETFSTDCLQRFFVKGVVPNGIELKQDFLHRTIQSHRFPIFFC